MFERFTEQARQVVVLAQEESRALKHPWLGTEHILLGLLREGGGIAAQALAALGVTPERARDRLAEIVPQGEEIVGPQIPFTPRGKNVLELALREALALAHNYVGTEHLLLGLVREREGVAARILDDLGASPDSLRAEVMKGLGDPPTSSELRGSQQPQRSADPSLERIGLSDALLDGAGPPLRELSREIEERLGRSPDAGDLLVLLGGVTDGIAARALATLGVDPDALAAAAEEARSSDPRSALLPSAAFLAEREQLRSEREALLEDLDERERKLLARARADSERREEELLAELRRRLGLADS